MNERTLYAIRQKSTGLYILDEDPQHRTRAEPSANNAFTPRLFTDAQSAKKSLTAWLKGIAYQDTDWETNDFDGRSFKVPIGVIYDEKEGRNKDDMEVVPVRLVLP